MRERMSGVTVSVTLSAFDFDQGTLRSIVTLQNSFHSGRDARNQDSILFLSWKGQNAHDLTASAHGEQARKGGRGALDLATGADHAQAIA
jgi:hypothetical protein